MNTDTIRRFTAIATAILALILVAIVWQEGAWVWGSGNQFGCALAGGHVVTVLGIASHCMQ